MLKQILPTNQGFGKEEKTVSLSLFLPSYVANSVRDFVTKIVRLASWYVESSSENVVT